MTFLGAGIGYRRTHRAALLGGPRPRVLELMPDHFFGDPASIEALAEQHHIVFHDVGLSLGTAGDAGWARPRLTRIRELVGRAHPLLFSEHLALTRDPQGVDLGHLAPLWRNEAQLSLLVERVQTLQDVLGVPIALENIAAPFDIPGGMPEPEFFAELVRRSGCGVALDVTNLLLTARNQGFDAAERVREYPLEAVRQVHLAGGYRDDQEVWVDSHSEPVEEAAFALLTELGRARDSLLTIIVERDDKLGSLDVLLAEARRAELIWEGLG
ncbi:MAG: hypothetical protein RL685_6295 [Pseudomonadota bacterium]|jgi:uncharacterized protein (UPF0276 family)